MLVNKKTVLFLLFFAGLIFFDQISKYVVRLRQPADSGFYVCNRGIAFGFELSPIFFWIIWLIIIAIASSQIFNFQFSIFPAQARPRPGGGNQFSINKFANFKFLGLILILSGAISNIIDRFAHGCIIDFIDIKFWPVFNLADVFITLGVILFIFYFCKKPAPRKTS